MLSYRRRRLLRSIGGIGLLGTVGMAGCIGDDDVVETQEVEIDEDGFEPMNVAVERDEPLSWLNTGETSYALLSANQTWDFKRPLDPGMTTAYTFTLPDVYRLVAREIPGDEEELDIDSEFEDLPEFTGIRMKIAVDRDIDDLAED